MLSQSSDQRPFTMRLIERLDISITEEAIRDSEMLRQSYNPATQTSDDSAYRGTALTYSTTTSGIPLSFADDSKSTDT